MGDASRRSRIRTEEGKQNSSSFGEGPADGNHDDGDVEGQNAVHVEGVYHGVCESERCADAF